MEGFFHLSKFHRQSSSLGLMPKCGACGLSKTCESPKMEPWGKGGLEILIVGEAPGAQEDRQGRPFVGPSGELLRQTIGRVGCSFEDDFLVTNAIICRPPGNKMPKNGREVDYCRPNLTRTLKEFEPKVVITLGRHALASVLAPFWKGEIGPLERWVGHTIPTKDFWICPTWHPSHLLREANGMMDRMFLHHLERACALRSTPSKVLPTDGKVEKLYEEKMIYEAIRQFDEAGKPCAFDYETNSLKPEYPKARIYSCSISDGRRTIAYPFFGKAITATSMFLKSRRTRKSASNFKFEERWTLKHLGHPVANWDWDSTLGAHVLDNRSGVCSLKFQAFTLLGVPSYNEPIEPYLGSSRHSHYNRIDEIDMNMLLAYNGLDSYLEVHVAERQKKAIGFPSDSEAIR